MEVEVAGAGRQARTAHEGEGFQSQIVERCLAAREFEAVLGGEQEEGIFGVAEALDDRGRTGLAP